MPSVSFSSVSLTSALRVQLVSKDPNALRTNGAGIRVKPLAAAADQKTSNRPPVHRPRESQTSNRAPVHRPRETQTVSRPATSSPFTERADAERRLGWVGGSRVDEKAESRHETSTLPLFPSSSDRVARVEEKIAELDYLRGRVGELTAHLNEEILHGRASYIDSPFDSVWPRGSCHDALDVLNSLGVSHGSQDDVTSGPGESAPEEQRDEENDISLQLPKLRDLLGLLRSSRERESDGREGVGPVGKVFLVGTGPGDPDLLTVKAWRLLQEADLVLYDRLVSRDVLDLIHPGARLLYVGKAATYHSRTQEEIHELLLSFAEAGATVVRLKGGDPLVFGRGGEEVEYLQAHGISVDIIPGITSAGGIAASLGMPLTHRGLANSVRFLTGHSRKGGEDPLHVAASAADPDSTLVVYMGLATLPGIVSKLMENGLPESTPAVAVERGTTPWQRNVFAQLKDLPEAVADAHLASPTLIIIGQVVALSRMWPAIAGVGTTVSDLAPVALGVGTSGPITTSTQQRDPRDRRLRSADPALPSERLRT